VSAVLRCSLAFLTPVLLLAIRFAIQADPPPGPQRRLESACVRPIPRSGGRNLRIRDQCGGREPEFRDSAGLERTLRGLGQCVRGQSWRGSARKPTRSYTATSAIYRG